ncbi:hypothetical protein [Phenylobacterium sp.]|jgi:hypothetical protein|uniref:hypothetical protein n=1 Tax=Phenylobacterium sp. TaxID=1871053 RepID=UPI002E2F7EA6|nr:hypothetical protein [Phenylobacterium sp.]HEX4710053.1 hypothetical protein [Phenylobacterium sp.]
MSLRTFIWTGAVLLALGAPLAACGKQGELQKPGPLSADGRAAERRAEERIRAAERPVVTIDRRDNPTQLDPGPIMDAGEIQGSGQNPLAPGPPAILPDPYLYPR